MRFQKIYMSGEYVKADPGDTVNFYRAENGMVIRLMEHLNMSGTFYEVFRSEEDMKANVNKVWTYVRLKDAKECVEGMA